MTDPALIAGLIALAGSGLVSAMLWLSALSNRGSTPLLATPPLPGEPGYEAAARRGIGVILAAFASGLSVLSLNVILLSTFVDSTGSELGFPPALLLGCGVAIVAAALGVRHAHRRFLTGLDAGGEIAALRGRAVVGGAIAEGFGVVAVVILLFSIFLG